MMRYKRYLVFANEGLMIFLALLSGGLLVFEETNTVTPEQLYLIDNIDITIALVFMIEFFAGFLISKNRKSFMKFHWWELLASIPITTPATQALRLLRLLRIIRIFRIGAHVIISKQNNTA